MSQPEDDLELQALARRLDDAFETTRPRAGFEDELWARMQARRPFGRRITDALGGLGRAVREAPAVPLAGVAALLVLAIGIGLLGYSGVMRLGGRAGGGGASIAAGGAGSAAGFGRLPSPSLAPLSRDGAVAANPFPAPAAYPEYAGPVQFTWNGRNIDVGTAPVFRYREPTATDADQFASSLGAALRGRPAGFLGSYFATDYSLEVRGTVQSPPQSPAYFIYSSPSMPAIDAAGAGPADIANIFLAAHSLAPQWNYNVAIDNSGHLTRVILQREFDAPGYGPAYLVDAGGRRYGMEVDLNGNQVVHVVGVLPVSMDVATYSLVPSDAAFRAAVAAPAPQVSSPAPAVQLTQVELAYLLVPAGEQSYYEPVYVYSGSLSMNGTTYTKHLVAPAVVSSQRTP